MPTYSPVIPTVIDELSVPPNTGDTINFDTRADQHVQEVVDMVPQINATNLQVYQNALSANESADLAATSLADTITAKDLAVTAKTQSEAAKIASEGFKDDSEAAAVASAASALAAATGGGLPVVPGAIGSVVTWDGSAWVSVLPGAPTVPTGVAVPAGNLLAIDDAGNTIAATALTTAVVEAVTAVSNVSIVLANGNVALLWSVSSNIYMKIVTKDGVTVLATMIVHSGSHSTARISATELSNGNIVLVFCTTSNVFNFKILNTSGTVVVTDTAVTNTSYNYSAPKVIQIDGGKFVIACATVYVDKFYLACHLNDGTTSWLLNVDCSDEPIQIALAKTSAGGCVAIAGQATRAGGVYTTSGVRTCYANQLIGDSINGSVQVSIACTPGQVFAVYRLLSDPYRITIRAISDTTGSPTNTAYGNYLPQISTGRNVNIYNTHVRVDSDGNYIVSISSNHPTDKFVDMYTITPDLEVLQTVRLLNEAASSASDTSVEVLPYGQNGKVIVWRAVNNNLKMAHIKSGKIIGISQGQVGSDTVYKVTGVATDLTSNNILNVGGLGVNLGRKGKKVYI